MLCGEAGSIDIGPFLTERIRGPATFTSVSTEGGSPDDGSKFSEPAMNGLISNIFGDESIFLKCRSGECLHETEVPGYERPIKKINTPLIASVIASCALFVAAVILLVWYLSGRPASNRYGPIYQPGDEDDEDAKLMTDHKPAALHFQDVSYSIKGKQILTGIQGAVRPGELMAIMGASGAGKTTFLDILARKNKKGMVQGSFYVNGEKVLDDDFRSVIGFVDQEDAMLPTLTVHETILDSALLRLPKDMSYAAKHQKVEDVERQLGIYHIRHQIIGSEEANGRGISGGEKRRVGIACELVTSPSILFLDEPTSGLDAYNAFNVVECLVDLVKQYQRTVVFTIHQPRSNIVALFDQLVLLASGRAVYSGPLSSCQTYFDNIGYPCPSGFNIADYLVDLTMHAGTFHEPPDDSTLYPTRNGFGTRASSAIAVKSLPSISNVSVGGESVPSVGADSQTRPRHQRKTSVRQQQERQLFTNKRQKQQQKQQQHQHQHHHNHHHHNHNQHQQPQEPPTSPKTDEEAYLDNAAEASQPWLRLSRTQGAPPPQVLDDPRQVSPNAHNTGTDLDDLVASYEVSDVAESLRDDIDNAISSAHAANGMTNESDWLVGATQSGRVKGYRKVGLMGQIAILSKRTWRNLYRNPMLMLTHYAIAIVLAVFLGFLFYGLTDDIKGFQNRLGLFFFLLALFGFSTLTSLTVFAPERLLFMRERAKGYYAPLSYFISKVLFDVIPLRLMPPIIMGTIVYPMTGLVPAWPEFFKFILFLVLFNLAAAAICLFIGIVFRNGGVANLLGSLVMLFSLLFSGFLLNHESIPAVAAWLQVVSRPNKNFSYIRCFFL